MAAPSVLSSAAVDRPAHVINSMRSPELSFPKCAPATTADGWLSTRVNQALWVAFPEATSEHDLAERAAPYFRNKRTGEPIEARTIRYWLRGDAIPHGAHMFTLIWMVGADFFSIPREGGRQ